MKIESRDWTPDDAPIIKKMYGFMGVKESLECSGGNSVLEVLKAYLGSLPRIAKAGNIGEIIPFIFEKPNGEKITLETVIAELEKCRDEDYEIQHG